MSSVALLWATEDWWPQVGNSKVCGPCILKAPQSHHWVSNLRHHLRRQVLTVASCRSRKGDVDYICTPTERLPVRCKLAARWFRDPSSLTPNARRCTVGACAGNPAVAGWNHPGNTPQLQKQQLSPTGASENTLGNLKLCSRILHFVCLFGLLSSGWPGTLISS